MPPDIFGSSEREDLARLYADLVAAAKLAAGALTKFGMDSPEFFDADSRVAEIWRQREVLYEGGATSPTPDRPEQAPAR